MTRAVIEAITKSGGTTFKVSLFGFGTGSGLTAKNSTKVKQPETTTQITELGHQWDAGMSVGGYVVKIKMWFFAAYDGIQEQNNSTIIRPLTTPGSPAVGSSSATTRARWPRGVLTAWCGMTTDLWRAGHRDSALDRCDGQPEPAVGRLRVLPGPESQARRAGRGRDQIPGRPHHERWRGFRACWRARALSPGRPRPATLFGRDSSAPVITLTPASNFALRVGVVFDPMKDGKSKIVGHDGRFFESIPMDINIRAFGGEVLCFCYNFSPDPDEALKGQFIDEYLFGFEREVAPGMVVSARYNYRSPGRVIEDFLVPAGGEYFVANPGEGELGKSLGFYDGTSVKSPKARRVNHSERRRRVPELDGPTRPEHQLRVRLRRLPGQRRGETDQRSAAPVQV